MNAYVFIGPTISAEEVRRHGDFVCLPPVAQGDVYRLMDRAPRLIGIIDGYFEGVPAVWHKEILWALACGVHVFGSASMGALRAAELDDFGMRGVGEIFAGYRDGSLEDDDEVALAHGPAEIGYVNVSVPMVNVRASLQAAVSAGVIDSDAFDQLSVRAKSIHYKQRTWRAVLAAAEEMTLSTATTAALQTWLEDGQVDQKRIDAVAMLKAMRQHQEQDPTPFRQQFHFEHTDMWAAGQVMFEAAARRDERSENLVLDEVRLDPARFDELKRRSMTRLMALDRARRNAPAGAEPSSLQLETFRSGLGLYSRRDLERWLAENDLDESGILKLLVEQGDAEAVLTANMPRLEPHLLAELKLSGDYAPLARRAAAKALALANDGGTAASDASAGVAPPVLLQWFFETYLGRAIPGDIDDFLHHLGFADREGFYGMMTREYSYAILVSKGCQISTFRGLSRMEQWTEPEKPFQDEGTRFRLFPQPPGESTNRQPETVVVSSPAGSVGPGPSDHRMYTVAPQGKKFPYGNNTGPLGSRWLYLPPWNGPVAAVAEPDDAGHFEHLDPDTEEFAAAHLFGSVRRVLDIWEGYFGHELNWHFGGDFERMELLLLPFWDNAQVGYGYLETGAHTTDSGTVMPFSLNFDVIAHEVGHAIIYSEVGMPTPITEQGEYFGFHESAADWVALLAVLHFPSFVDALLVNTSGNLYTFNRFNRLSEFTENDQIRLASNQLTLWDFVSGWRDEHKLSQPLTGALFDCFVDIFHEGLLEAGVISRGVEELSDIAETQPQLWPSVQREFDDAFADRGEVFRATLLETRDLFGRYLARTWSMLTPHYLNYLDVGLAFMQADMELSAGRFRTIIDQNFGRRGIGRVQIGPALERPGPSSHAFSSRIALPVDQASQPRMCYHERRLIGSI